MSGDGMRFKLPIVSTGIAGVLLLFGIGNLVGLEWPDWLVLPVLLWPVWVKILLGVGTVIALLVVLFFLSLLLLVKNYLIRFVYAVLVCAACAAEAGILGISYDGATIWEGGGIPSVPHWAAIVMTVFGGLLALYGISGIMSHDDY